MNKVRPIAIHLPQFHPFKENNEWWGEGFTEWTNVTKARPRFDGHYQPHLPTETGLYDLRVPEVREMQASMALAHGIEGFCYYHYWFNGKRLMNQPLDEILKSKKPDFPFMFCWANENWSRRWDGEDSQLLIKQDYSTEDDIQHIRFLGESFFKDDRYIKVEGKPFFVVYRPANFPDIKKTAELWRYEMYKMGFKGIYLGYMNGFDYKKDPKDIGFDCAIDFQPDFYSFPKPVNNYMTFWEKIGLKKYRPNNRVDRHFDYLQIMDIMLRNWKSKSYKIYPSLFPMWDNSARRKKGAEIIINSSPDAYENWLSEILRSFKPYTNEENFIFINAWNEWAEGNHLEPCVKYGNQYLEVTRNVLKK
ncbi:MAG: glycoside hydrolase family 99-like domain-containing protein [Cytophagales bacterium]